MKPISLRSEFMKTNFILACKLSDANMEILKLKSRLECAMKTIRMLQNGQELTVGHECVLNMVERETETGNLQAQLEVAREAVAAADDLIAGLHKMVRNEGCREYSHKVARWESTRAALKASE